MTEPKVMGIINTTPDSFYSESRKTNIKSVLETAEKMLDEGATFLDIGGYSSRPNADHISEEEEIKRVMPVIESVKKEFSDSIVSIDTFRAGVATAAIAQGADLVNDITGGQYQPKILKIVSEARMPYIGMHMRGMPNTMQSMIDDDNVLEHIFSYFSALKKTSHIYGINDLILDPGFGFAKTLEQNYYILNNLSYFKQLDCPILVGISRKSMIYKLLGVRPEDALNGTSALNMVALFGGADILRVHDIKEAIELIKLNKALNDSGF